jgi:hypothetical protein
VKKRYTVSVVRERLAEALDAAESGIPVFIERKGVRYRLAVDQPKAKPPRRSTIEVLDPAVREGEWTWDSGPKGLRFRRRRS